MQFLADENISRRVIERLRADGHVVVAVQETRGGISDPEVLVLAGQSHILITEDQDFGELVIRRQLRAAGVLLLELDRLSNSAEAERVAAVVREIGAKLPGNLIIIEPARTRIRPLPARC